jgi:hypothetical protein
MAPPLVLIFAEERSVFSADAPTSAQIESALRRAALAPGGWIGPHARITRTAQIGERFRTRFAWLYGWPPATVPTLAAAPVAELLQRVNDALGSTSYAWQGAEAQPFAEAVNGSLAWWTSGQASNTRTRDVFPTGTGRLMADENPIGPTSAATHPPTPGDILSGAATQGTDLVTALSWLVGIGLAGYVAVNLAPMLRPRRRYYR